MNIKSDRKARQIFFENQESNLFPYFIYKERKYYLIDFEKWVNGYWNARGAIRSFEDIVLKLIDDSKNPAVIVGTIEN